VSVPSFPSKIIEYCANALPVIVSVEPTSDAGHLIEDRNAGLVTTAGDATQLARAIARLSSEQVDGTLNQRGIAAKRLFETEFSVEVAARRMAGA
jgi:glycosyltransferase involved in cell wall biosynthesis